LSRLEKLLPQPERRDVSAVILIHNNALIIERCLSTLLKHCKPYLAQVIVVDNASTDGGAELVERSFPDIIVKRNPKNGCSSGRNIGIANSIGKYIAFFDSDQWFSSGTSFAEALAILENHASIGMVGWNAGWFDRRDRNLGGPISDYLPRRGMNAEADKNGFRTDIGFLGTSGLFMRRATFKSGIEFDPAFDPTCFEDTDLCFQVRALGMKLAFRDLSGINHEPHQTTGANSGSKYYNNLFKRNSNYFRQKWSASSDFFTELSSD
jgi:GT2 family glycosyltransferase